MEMNFYTTKHNFAKSISMLPSLVLPARYPAARLSPGYRCSERTDPSPWDVRQQVNKKAVYQSFIYFHKLSQPGYWCLLALLTQTLKAAAQFFFYIS